MTLKSSTYQFMKTLVDRYFIMATFTVVTVHLLLHMHLGYSQGVAAFTSFIFGDSLVDVGNNDYLFTLSKADSPPYGIDFAPSDGNPTGRFTNGRTVNDIIDETLGASSFSKPYLDPYSNQEDAIIRGLNYASGSSGILDETGTLFIGRIPLSKQVSNFEQTKTQLVNLIGHQKAEELINNAMFSITTGSNDILNYMQQKSLTSFWYSNSDVSPSMFQRYLISNMTMQLKRLQHLGARKILVVGVGPLGCIPIVRALNFVPLGKCSEEVNKFVRSFNSKLRRILEHLNRKTYPRRSVFAFANTYETVTRIIQNPAQYGFENAYDPCCGGHFPPFICYGGAKADGNSSTGLCQDRSKFVFWDAYHPTEAVNVLIANELLDGDRNVVSPMNVRGLHNY